MKILKFFPIKKLNKLNKILKLKKKVKVNTNFIKLTNKS